MPPEKPIWEKRDEGENYFEACNTLTQQCVTKRLDLAQSLGNKYSGYVDFIIPANESTKTNSPQNPTAGNVMRDVINKNLILNCFYKNPSPLWGEVG